MTKRKPKKSPRSIQRIVKKIRERQQLDRAYREFARDLKFIVAQTRLENRWP